MQRNLRPPGGLGSGNAPSQYEWHTVTQTQKREVSSNGSSQSYPMTHTHPMGGIPPQMGVSPSSSGGSHGAPASNRMAQLLPLQQNYSSGIQTSSSSSMIHGGGGGTGVKIHPPEPPGGQKLGPHGGSLQQLQQVNLGDISVGAIPLADLTSRVKSLGFPVSCGLVIRLLERYFSSQLDGKETMPGTLQDARDNLINLINTFILYPTSPPSSPCGGDLLTGDAMKGGIVDLPPVLGPVEDMQLLLTIHNQLEEQKNLELRYCVFEAIFGAEVNTSSCLLDKLISLSLSLESKGLLLCIAVWMNGHPLRALSLAQNLFHEFCVLLPDALGPLLGLASHSPHMAYQIAAAFTTLHPFHVVGKLMPGVDTSHLHPPIRMLQILSHWVDSNPEFFYSSYHADLIPSKLPLLHSHSMTSDSHVMRSPITGIIQWCILAPMVNDSELYSSTGAKSGSDTDMECNFHQLLAQLHAEILSILLSLSQTQSLSRSSPSLDSDDVAMIVAALIAYGQKQEVSRESDDGSRCGRQSEEGSGRTRGRMMEESVERFAQFLQISLSEKILELKQDDMNSIASNLPKNRLLELVISHCKLKH